MASNKRIYVCCEAAVSAENPRSWTVTRSDTSGRISFPKSRVEKPQAFPAVVEVPGWLYSRENLQSFAYNCPFHGQVDGTKPIPSQQTATQSDDGDTPNINSRLAVLKTQPVAVLRPVITSAMKPKARRKFQQKLGLKSNPGNWTKEQLVEFIEAWQAEHPTEQASPAEPEDSAPTAAPKAQPKVDPKKTGRFASYFERDEDRMLRTLAQRHADGFVSAYILGETGSGKSFMAEWLANKLDYEFVETSLDKFTQIQRLFAQRDLKNGSTVSTPSHLSDCLERGKVVWLLDEVNNAGDTTYLHELLNSGRVYHPDLQRDVTLGEGVVIIMTGNPRDAKYTGSRDLNIALIDRARIVIKLENFSAAELSTITGLDAGKAEGIIQLNEIMGRDSKRALIGVRGVRVLAEDLDLFGEALAIKNLLSRIAGMDHTAVETAESHLNQFFSF